MRYLLLFIFMHSFLLGQEVVISENFEQGLPNDWSIESTHPKRNWIYKSYKDFHYMHMSAFGGKGKPGFKVKATLHTPLLDLTEKNCKLKFSFADAFKKGQPLRVIISNEQKKILTSLPFENWEKLVNNTGSYDNNLESTPWIPLPKIQQAYHVSFVYNSTPNENSDEIATTLIQLGEVDIWCE